MIKKEIERERGAMGECYMRRWEEKDGRWGSDKLGDRDNNKGKIE